MYWADTRNQAIRRGNWKLIHFGPNLEGGRFELYDLEADPSEANDLFKSRPQTAGELKVELSRQVSLDAP